MSTPDNTSGPRVHAWITGAVGLGLVAGALLQFTQPAVAWLPWLGFGLAYATGGIRIASGAWRVFVAARQLSIDALMGLAAVGAALVGSPLEGSVLIFLFSLSNLLESLALGRTRVALSQLVALRPREVRLADEHGHERGSAPAERLRRGDIILVRPGERIAADGVVRSGRSAVDQSAITGESVPVERAPGDEVFAGSINAGGALVIAVTKAGAESTLARIIRLVEEARERRAPAQHFIDRWAHPYTLAVLLFAALLAAVPPLFLEVAWGAAFYRAMTLLVVASPCALVISTPAAILSGIANGARHGVLFKGGAYLDLAGTIDTVAFDKTGTLTAGRPRVSEIVAIEDIVREATGVAPQMAAGPAQHDVLRCAAALERHAEHHIARAVLEAARAYGIAVPAVDDFAALPGYGVTGTLDGAPVWIGNPALAQRMGARVPTLLRGWIAEQTSLARSVVFVGRQGAVIGALAVGDALKPLAAATIRHLRYEGIRWIAILSGDHPDAVRAIAAELGADEVRAGLLPHEKVDAVRQLVAASRGVAMVGDGVNDAPALASATLGIAMGAAGTDVAIETADVVIMGDEVERVDFVIHLGRRARRVVRQNIVFSVAWMLLLVVASLAVAVPLALAVMAHEGSTLLVAANGLRLLAGRPHAPDVPPGTIRRRDARVRRWRQSEQMS